MDIGIQGSNILIQARIFAVSQLERSRLNTAFVTCNFIGGAAGSAATAILWSAGGWRAVMIAGVLLSAFALVVWMVGRRGPLLTGEPPSEAASVASPSELERSS